MVPLRRTCIGYSKQRCLVSCFILHEIDFHEIQDWAMKTRLGPSSAFTTGTILEPSFVLTPDANSAMKNQGWVLKSLEADEVSATQEPLTSWVEHCRSSSYGKGWSKGKYTVPRYYRPPSQGVNGDILPPPVMTTAG